MIKPDKNFRLSKPAKTQLALMYSSADSRNFYKSLLIQGELAAEAARKASLKSKGNKSKDSLLAE